MDEFIEMLILAYFKTHPTDYSFQALAGLLGLSVKKTTACVQELLDQGYLAYSDSLLALTLKGRGRIQNEAADYCRFQPADPLLEDKRIFLTTRLSFEDVYIPADFSKKLK